MFHSDSIYSKCKKNLSFVLSWNKQHTGIHVISDKNNKSY